METAGSKALLNTDAKKLVEAMSILTPPAIGTTTLSDIQQTTLAPVIATHWH